MSIALAPVRRYLAEAEAPLDPTAPVHASATLLFSRVGGASRLLHATIAATPPANMRVAGVNGTLDITAEGIGWEPGRSARLLGAVEVHFTWRTVRSAAMAPAERGIPTRILSVDTPDGGFDVQVGDRLEPHVSAALRHFGGYR